jgi:ankyrin repeat protein
MDASFSNPIDLSRTSSWEINKAARKACQNRNGTGTLNVISEGILYGVEFERPHLFSKVNITKIIPLGEHIATLSTSAEMNAFRKAHLGAFNGLSTLNTEIKKVQAKSEVNGMMERVRSGGRRLSENEWNKVVEFTKKGLIDINHTDSNNDTLLHLAARCNEIYMIKSLTKAGVNINAQDKDGNTPLMVAVQEGKLYAVKQLVQLGAKLNPTNPSGQAALTLAEGNTRIRKYLEQARTAQTEISEIIRRNSGGSGLGKLSDSDCKKIEGFIRDGLINVNATYPGDDTLLHLIVHRGQPPLMKQLIKAGANPNARNTSGKTALMAAASYGNRAMIKPLIDRGADPNIQDNDGRTALMAATTAKFQSTIEELVEAGANLNVKNKQGMTASDLAKGNPGMAEHFKPQNKINEIMRRAKHGKISEKDWKIIQGLIKKKSISDANPTNVNGSVNVNSTDSHGNTLLHLAVMSNKPDMVKLLIDAGAYINQPDRSGQTAFTLAAKKRKSGGSEVTDRCGSRCKSVRPQRTNGAHVGHTKWKSGCSEAIGSIEGKYRFAGERQAGQDNTPTCRKPSCRKEIFRNVQ